MLLSLVITRAKEFAFLRNYYYCFLIKMVGRKDQLWLWLFYSDVTIIACTTYLLRAAHEGPR
jgi:hypothetical protein